jgi:hypothetical protein
MVALTEDAKEQYIAISDAGKAMQVSSLPARVAIIALDTPRNRLLITSLNTGKVRSHILASAPPKSIYLSPIEIDKHGLTSSPPILNPSKLILVLIENKLAPGFLFSSLHNAILNLNPNLDITSSPPPWTYLPFPEDHIARPPNSNLDRLPPSSYPHMLWSRSDIAAATVPSEGPIAEAIKTQKPKDRPSKGDKIHAILACLGITPPDLQKTHNMYASPENFFNDPPKLTRISKIILHSTLDIVRKSEAMRKWKRRCLADPCLQ